MKYVLKASSVCGFVRNWRLRIKCGVGRTTVVGIVNVANPFSHCWDLWGMKRWVVWSVYGSGTEWSSTASDLWSIRTCFLDPWKTSPLDSPFYLPCLTDWKFLKIAPLALRRKKAAIGDAMTTLKTYLYKHHWRPCLPLHESLRVTKSSPAKTTSFLKLLPPGSHQGSAMSAFPWVPYLLMHWSMRTSLYTHPPLYLPQEFEDCDDSRTSGYVLYYQVHWHTTSAPILLWISLTC